MRRVSEGDMPPTIGGFDRVLGRRSSQKSQFGLATFMRGDEEGGNREREDSDGGLKHNNATSPAIAAAANVESGRWGASRNRENESGDDLRSTASKETLQGQGNQSQAIPKSFLGVEGRKD
jgi:hypothetical protein